MTNITLATLVAAIALSSATLAPAQAKTLRHHAVTSQSFETRDVSMPQGPSAAEEAWMDRASKSWDGGGY